MIVMTAEYPILDPVEASRRYIREQHWESVKQLQATLEELELDPKKISALTVKNYVKKGYQLETDKLNENELNGEDQLEILRRLEKWYTDRELQFPNPAWLDQQRAKYQQS